MAKLTLSDLSSLSNETSATNTMNANSALIETALENTLSRDGTAPNQMEANLDMNSNRIINLLDPVSDQEPVTKSYGDSTYGNIGAVNALAVAAAASAATSVANAATTTANVVTTAANAAASIASQAAAEAAEVNAEAAETGAEAALGTVTGLVNALIESDALLVGAPITSGNVLAAASANSVRPATQSDLLTLLGTDTGDFVNQDTFDDLRDDIYPALGRIFVSSGSTYVVDPRHTFPGYIHYVSFNGTATLDFSNCSNYRPYAMNVFDFEVGRCTVDTGVGNTIIGSNDRDGSAGVQAISLHGGEAMIIERVAGNAFAVIAGIGNPSRIQTTSGTLLTLEEDAFGKFHCTVQGTASASAASNFDAVISGITIDFTGATVMGLVIHEANTTSRDPLKVGTPTNNGTGGGRIPVYNSNAASLTATVTLKNVTVVG